MNSVHRLAALGLCASCATASFAQSTLTVANGESEPPLSEVLVTGEQPGPGLWKISKGDHTLWIFGTYSPLPKKVSWRSNEVEAIIAASQELLTPVDVKARMGFFGTLSVLPSLIGLRNNPGKEKLEEIVPADLYARWLAQKKLYLPGDDSVEKRRPLFAADELYGRAVELWGFKPRGFPPKDEVRAQIERLAKKHKVTVTKLELSIDVSRPRAWVKDFKTMRLDELPCFTQTIESVESDREPMRMRANAWAVGDVGKLRAASNAQQRNACIDVFFAILNSAEAKQHGLDDIPRKAVSTWVAAAETALTRNTSTFATLSIDEIYWAEGPVARLRAKGYSVEEP